MQGTQVFVEEELSRLDFDAEDMTYAIKDMKPKRLAHLESKLLDKFPNTHSFTKSLAEHVLVAQHDVILLVLVLRGGANTHDLFLERATDNCSSLNDRCYIPRTFSWMVRMI